VSDQLWQAAQERTKARANPSASLKRGGRARNLLSGLLKCGVCGRSYSAWGAADYACGGHIDGRACTNDLRVKRKHAEKVILGPVFDELLDPERVEWIAKWLQREWAAALEAQEARNGEAPQELREIDERIARLRKRLRDGDPDLTSDELQAALDRALGKRQALADIRPSKASAKLLRMLPDTARRYREKIAAGLDGDRDEAERAREVLRNEVLLGGEIELVPEGRALWAEFALLPPVILPEVQAIRVGNQGFRTVGSGGTLPPLLAAIPRQRPVRSWRRPSHKLSTERATPKGTYRGLDSYVTCTAAAAVKTRLIWG
jgi:site-specific DNA recombinase